MFETVTVDQAIARGQRMVNYPVFIIMFGIIGLSIYLTTKNILSGPFLAISIPGAIILAWLYWSFMITKWRIWAFDNVQNVHQLKKKAVDAQLIWPDGSFWEKTEIRSVGDKEKLHILEAKFEKADVFTDDYLVPEETIVYFSKSKSLLNMIFMLGCLAVGIYFLCATSSYIIGALLCLLGAYFAFTEYRNARNKTPQIILNKKGIQTVNIPFYKWEEIENDEVVRENNGKDVSYYLVYDSPTGIEKLNIDEYNTNKKTLENLLQVYRVRSNPKPAINK